jgi:hypothetical protein
LLSKLVLASLFLSISAKAYSSNIAKNQQWHRLLHYRSTLLSSGSRVLNPSFFLSTNGRLDPRAELVATLSAIEKDWRVICEYPARYTFLKKFYPELQRYSLQNCHELQKWANNLGRDRIDLVFAGAYPNNPASLFGHTLLRFHKNSRHPLLDYAVAFLAQTPNEGFDFLHTWRGITGKYIGHFEFEIFSVTIGLYNNSDSRDLWAYELNLDQEQREMIIYHLWELSQNAGFKYYFLSENCSYMLLALLEVALPETDLLNNMSGFILPLETIKTAIDKIQGTQYIEHRLSIKEKILKRWINLTHDEKNLAIKLLKQKVQIEEIELSVELAEILIDILHQDFYAKNSNVSAKQKQLMLTLGSFRGQYPRTTPDLTNKQTPGNGPHQAHAPKRLSIGWQDQKYQLEIGMGLHNYSDRPNGYQGFSYIDYLNLRLLYDQSNNQFRLDRFQLIEVNSLQKLSTLYPYLSWQLELAWLDHHELYEKSHLMGRAGAGITHEIAQYTQAIFIGLRGITTLKSYGNRLHGYGEFIQLYRPKFAHWMGLTTRTQWLLHHPKQWYEIRVGLNVFSIENIVITMETLKTSGKDNYSLEVTYRF